MPSTHGVAVQAPDQHSSHHRLSNEKQTTKEQPSAESNKKEQNLFNKQIVPSRNSIQTSQRSDTRNRRNRPLPHERYIESQRILQSMYAPKHVI